MPEVRCSNVECNVVITDDDFKIIAWQEEFPDIKLGPYCRSCWETKVRVCSSCQHAFISDGEDGEHIKYYDNGVWMCTECAANAEVCGECNSMVACDHETPDGKMICLSCFQSNYFSCGCCNETYHKDKNVFYADPHLKDIKQGMYKKYGDMCGTCYDKHKDRFKTYDIQFCKRCDSSYITSANEGYCDNCKEYLIHCNDCGITTHEYEDFYYNGKSKFTCTKCYKKYKYCELCNTNHLKEDFKTIFDRGKMTLVCSKIKGKCTLCHTYSTRLFNMNGKELCLRCKDSHNICIECDNVFINHDSSSGDRCSKCIAKSRSYSINGYSYKPLPIFHHTNDVREDYIYMGVENELSAGYDLVNDIIVKGGDEHFYAKSDSSINGEGFEIVTHPHTLFAHKKMACPLAPGVGKNNSCGMHIHISKDNFKTFHIYKFMSFFNKQKPFIEKIAERSSCSYSRDLSHDACKKTSKNKNNSERYQAVNLSNKNTVEVRVFASAVNESTYYKNIEFVHALVSFTRDANKKDATSVEKFKAFVADNKKLYNNLDAFINE